MNKHSNDVALGALVLGAFGLFIWAISGLLGILFFVGLIITGAVVIRLFESELELAKVLAIVMLPALLLTYLKPKRKAPPEETQP